MDSWKNILDEINRKNISYLLEMDFKSGVFSVSKKSLSIFMGYSNDIHIPEPLDAAFDAFFNLMPGYLKPTGGFAIFKNIKIEDNGFYCENIFFHTGKIIASNLKDSEYLAFFMVTAGIKLDEWSAAAFKEDNLLLGYTIDCAGSEIAEELADKIEKKILDVSSVNITNRYSPGYCGWNVSEQQKLFSLFPDNFCRITLTKSSLMIPIKSLSGVIGIGKNVKQTDYQCSICERESCFKKSYLKDKISCFA